MDAPIIVGTDGSETAAAAVDEAIRLAVALDQPLHIVSAYRPLPKGGASGLPAEFDLHSDSQVQSILDEAKARARVKGIDAAVHARTGDPAEAILDMAAELEAALVIVGNKGIGSVKRFVLGNVPSKVVHHAPCSTYVVHTA